MIASVAKRFILIGIAIKTFFSVIFEFFWWLVTRNVSKFFLAIILAMGISWGFGFYKYVSTIKQNWKQIEHTTPDIEQKTDAIVVLTGGSDRVRQSLWALENGLSDKLFISGVNVDVKLNELLDVHGYKDERAKNIENKITLGYAAEDTFQNALEISRWIQRNNVKSIRLITSNYHIDRAQAELSHVEPALKIVPHSVIPVTIRIDKWWESKFTRGLLLTEYNKLVMAKIRIFLENIGL